MLHRSTKCAWARVAWLRRSSHLRVALPLRSSSCATSVEPSWHQRLRSKRKRQRDYLKASARVWLGKRRIKRVRRLIASLSRHHSWNPKEYPIAIRRLARADPMTWHCGYCNIPNSQSSETCSKCGYHWTAVWKQGKKRDGSKPRTRSQQRPPKTKPSEKTKNKEKGKQGQQEEQEWAMFPSSVPWLQSSPQARLPVPKENVEAQEAEASQPIPPQPVLPAPPNPSESKMTPLSDEEMKMLTHLRGIDELGSLPEMLKPQLQMLELRNQAQLPNRGLTHGHVNRLHKTRNQVQSIVKKINDLDMEWSEFMKDTKARFQIHVEHYHQHRQELKESLRKKLQDLEMVKAEVTTASKSLTSQPATLEMPSESPPLEEAMQFQQMMATSQPQDLIQEIPSDAEEEDELMDSMDGQPKTRTSLAPRPFRVAGSPQKVATNHLKRDPKEAKQIKEEHKGKPKEDAS
eukprot:Skav229640  [mRNA]  locus=scaffold649:303487:305484:+ [translate_table: standard]